MNLSRSILFYIISIIIFSFVYWVIFLRNSSSFIIEPQMNEITNDIYAMPYSELTYHITSSDIPLSINDFNNILKPKFDSISTLHFFVDSLEKHEKFAKIIRDSIQNDVGKSINSNIDSLVSLNTKSTIDKRDSIQNLTDNLSKQENSPELDLTIAYKRVDIAKLNSQIAIIEANIRNKTIKNLSLYADVNLATLHDSLYREYTSNLDSLIIANESLRKIKSDVYYLTKAYHKNRTEKVSYWDFLYFSLLASTSNNFGDITPNSTSVKSTICLQILFSIIFIGLLVDLIIKSFNRNES